MEIKFSSKPTIYGWTHQLVFDDVKKEYKYGSYLFGASDVANLTKRQLDDIEKTLIENGYIKTN